MRHTDGMIELFAGGGGVAISAAQAGIPIVWAANHNATACAVYARNHPSTRVVQQDLFSARWSDIPRGAFIQWASVACTGFTDARGADQARHGTHRNTAWCVVSCAEHHRTPIVCVENVGEFTEWNLWPAWMMAMQALGYIFHEALCALAALGPKPAHPDGRRLKKAELPPEYVRRLESALAACVIDSADCGAPQERERVFIVGVHKAHARVAFDLKQPKQPHVPASSFIDFSAGTWSPVEKEGRAEATLARIANGRKAFGERFVAPFYGSGSGLTGRSLDRPIGTVTTLDRWALVDGDRMRMLTIAEYKAAMGFPQDYWLPPTKRDALFLLGNAVETRTGRYVLEQVLSQF